MSVRMQSPHPCPSPTMGGECLRAEREGSHPTPAPPLRWEGSAYGQKREGSAYGQKREGSAFGWRWGHSTFYTLHKNVLTTVLGVGGNHIIRVVG